MAFKPVNNSNLYVEVVNSIITAIATGELKAGEKIKEQQIADEMNISRAPIREAIRDLAAQGIVEYAPKKGATVATLSEKSIRETYSLRALLEGMAVHLAIENITDEEIKKMEDSSKEMTEKLKEKDVEAFIEKDVEFHNFICEKCNHSKLQKLIKTFVIQTRLFMIMSKYNMLINSSLSKEYGVHDKIIEKIKIKDKEGAEKEMRNHITTSGEVLINYLLERKEI